MAHLIPNVYQLDAPVGRNQTNAPDVLLVQTLLNEVARFEPEWVPAEPLPKNGNYSETLLNWILAFQRHSQKKHPTKMIVTDGIVHPLPSERRTDANRKFSPGATSILYGLNSLLAKFSPTAYEGVKTRLSLKARYN